MGSNRIKGQKIQIGDNFVLPIEQTRVTKQQAKVQQIIEETDAKAQQIIAAAENKSQVVLSTASTEAERIVSEARKRAQTEYDTIKQQAYQEGFQQGLQDGLYKFQQDAVEGIKSLDTLASTNFDIKKNIIDSASRDIVDLVNVIANKVCHISFSDDILYKITVDAIKQLKVKENITIIVNPKLVENISKLLPEIKREFQTLETLKIVEDNSISVDGVIIETPQLRLDSRVSAQIAEIAQKMLTEANDELEQE